MATAIIIDKINNKTKIIEKNKKTLVSDITNGSAKISELLPFRVRFKNIGIASYLPSNPAPIGIAIIGLNNYIL